MHLYSLQDLRVAVGTGADTVVDVTGLLDDGVSPQQRMAALIADWPRLRGPAQEALTHAPELALADVTLRAPLPFPATIVAAPVNYRRHQVEMGGEEGVYPGAVVQGIETYAGFIKASSSVIGPDEPIRLPFPDRRFDHEAEVGVVIGATASRVPRERAWDHVFGFVPLLDITMRGPEDRSYRKSFDTFTPIGPAIVSADEVADLSDIEFDLAVNEQMRQRASTRDLIYDIPRLVELYSDVITLRPGDLIATGTPEGVGEITPGDEIVLTVHGIGRLTMAVGGR